MKEEPDIQVYFRNGHAKAFLTGYEDYKEVYEVHVYTGSPKYAYDNISFAIAWGVNHDFTVLSVKGEPLDSVMPEIEGDLVKKFRFVKR